MAGAGAGGVQEGAAGAPGPVDDFFGQDLEVVAVVGFWVADQLDDAGPAAADADHLVAFAQCADGDGTDGRVQPGYIAAAGQDTDHAFGFLNVCHNITS